MNETTDNITISSAQNQTLKLIRKLQQKKHRTKTGLFIAEGEDLVASANEAGWQPQELLCVEGSGLAGTPVEPELLADVSSLGSGAKTIGIYKQRWEQASGEVNLYLHEVGDPGNLGTVLRSAVAFGASTVLLSDESVDPYSPKAVQASMGAIFKVAVARASVSEIDGYKLALAVESQYEALETVTERPITLLLGAEREGLPESITALADRVVRIPIEGDSLNVAMAATVALYEVTKVS